MKVAGPRPAILLKKRHQHKCFFVNSRSFQKQLFYRKPLNSCFCYKERLVPIQAMEFVEFYLAVEKK